MAFFHCVKGLASANAIECFLIVPDVQLIKALNVAVTTFSALLRIKLIL